MRDLSRPERVFQVNAPGLESTFAPLRSLDRFPSNLPVQLSSFIGRDKELARVATALEDARVVTLTGVGGVGKTRLALQVAADLLPRFREGAWLVELAPVRDPDDVVGAFAGVFGVSARAGQSLEQRWSSSCATKQLLLIVDNCEHLLGAVAELVTTLERSCAGLIVLATSREGLGVEGERMLVVPSLGVAGRATDLDSIVAADAVQLFVARATAAKADFVFDGSERGGGGPGMSSPRWGTAGDRVGRGAGTGDESGRAPESPGSTVPRVEWRSAGGGGTAPDVASGDRLVV